MSKCILVVEDQADNRRILRDLLGNAGYELIEAESGEDALSVVADSPGSDLDGYSATGHGRLRGDAAHQVQSGLESGPDHRRRIPKLGPQVCVLFLVIGVDRGLLCMLSLRNLIRAPPVGIF